MEDLVVFGRARAVLARVVLAWAVPVAGDPKEVCLVVSALIGVDLTAMISPCAHPNWRDSLLRKTSSPEV